MKRTLDGRGVILSRTVDLPLPFPRWKWFDSDTIEDIIGTKKELYQHYVSIFNASKTKQIDELIVKFDERIDEYTRSLYLPGGEMNTKLKKSFLDELNDSEKELWDTGWDDSELEVFGYGKLARLTDWEGRPYIAFVNKDNTSSSEYDIIFRKSGDK